MSYPTPIFPGGIVGASRLTVATNRLTTSLSSGITAGDVTMTVASAAGITANSLLSIYQVSGNTIVGAVEIVFVSLVVGNVLTIQRGFDGTTAAAHASGAAVSGFVDAWHHNSLAAEVIAIEEALGTNLGTNGLAASFNFAPQTPGGSLIIGANTITLTPVPPGVNGTDSNHYLYISGGAGTAEAVLIIGGTAVAGAASGTVIVVCANTHSGAWTVQSATAGGQEAAQAIITAGTPGTVVFPPGISQFYAPMTIPAAVNFSVRGQGPSTIINANQITGNVFVMVGQYISLSNLDIHTNSGAGANITAIFIGSNLFCSIREVHMLGPKIGIAINGTTSLNMIDDCGFISLLAGSTGISMSGTASGNTAIRNFTAAPQIPATLSLGISLTCSSGSLSGVWIYGSNVYQANIGLNIVATGTGAISQIFDTDSVWGGELTNGILIQPNGAGATIANIFIKGSEISLSGAQGVVIGNAAGTVNEVVMTGVSLRGNGQDGVLIGTNTLRTVLSNCAATANSLSAGNTYSGIAVAAGANNFSILGGYSGTPAGGFQKYGISIAAGASDHYVIQGVNLEGNDTAALNDLGTGVHRSITGNLGVDSATPPTVASAGTIALPATDAPVIYVTGTTTITTITPGDWIGRRITLIKTDAGTLTVGGGGIIPIAVNLIAASNPARTMVFDGTNWY